MAIYEDNDMSTSDHPAPAMPACPTGHHAQWTDVLGDHELADGGRWFARRGAHEIALFRIQGTVHAIADSCPHNGASLATGQLEGTTIKCRAHGLRFDVATGCPRGAGGLAVRTYSARVHDGRVEVDLGASPGDPAPPANPMV